MRIVKDLPPKGTPSQNDVNAFLTQLRDSGKINMFGASPVVAKHFNMDIKIAREMTVNWMGAFDKIL